MKSKFVKNLNLDFLKSGGDPSFSISSPITIDPILTALNRLLAILNIFFSFSNYDSA